MSGVDRDTPDRRPRLGVVVLLLVLAGMPFILTSRLLSSEFSKEAPIGTQPGGRVAGRLVDVAGVSLAGLQVELWLVDAGGGTELHDRMSSGRGGEFSFEVPALEGCYLLRTGGGTHRRLERFVSLVGREQVSDLELELAAGCTLTVVIESEPPVLGGRAVLTGRLSNGPLFGLVPLELRPIERRFKGAEVSIDGLPPLDASVRIELDGGRRIEFDIELSPGETRRTFRAGAASEG